MTTQIITEQTKITPLNLLLRECRANVAFYQLEEYHTNTAQLYTIGCIRKYKSTKKFEFSIGDTVNVRPLVRFTPETYAIRLIENNWLKKAHTY